MLHSNSDPKCPNCEGYLAPCGDSYCNECCDCPVDIPEEPVLKLFHYDGTFVVAESKLDVYKELKRGIGMGWGPNFDYEYEIEEVEVDGYEVVLKKKEDER